MLCGASIKSHDLDALSTRGEALDQTICEVSIARIKDYMIIYRQVNVHLS